MERVTATIDRATLAKIRRIAGRRGVSRFLAVAATERIARLEAPDETVARRAGQLRFEADGDDGIDALVAAAAVGDGTPAVVLTSDPGDLERLLEPHPRVQVRSV